MANLVGIAGSLRRASYNRALLVAAQDLLPAGSRLEVVTLRGIPLYDADLEQSEGVPEPVVTLQDRIAAADGVILATPEYNNSVPGVTKNALDWLSRPPSEIRRVFAGRPFALVGASPGGFGTVLGQAAWLPVMRTLGVRLWTGGKLYVSRAAGAFDEEGRLASEEARSALRKFLAGFVAAIEEG